PNNSKMTKFFEKLSNDYIFVMSYMSNGSLNDYLSNNFKDVTWKMKLDFLRDIVIGIKWIHKNKIVHRDIHDGNILIGNLKWYGPDSRTSIADLGFSWPANDDLDRMIMWELTTGCRPFCDRAYDSYLALDICAKMFRPNITKDTPQCWAILMQKCWHSNPLKRPTIDEIYDEVNSAYWDENKCYIKEAENKRQELLSAGKFLVKYMHPHSKTHSKLLNPTIDSMLLDLFQ
ncbi:21454_t:CDS:2, partial [Racocetra persica]